MDKIVELRQALGRAVDKLNTDEVLGDEKLYEAAEQEVAALEGQLSRAEKAQGRSAALARPVGGAGADHDDEAAILVPSQMSLDSVAPRSARMNWDSSNYLRAARSSLGFNFDATRHFPTLGEQLQAVARYSMSGKDPHALDARLKRAPTGAGEVDPSAGGFLVQTDFVTAVFARAYTMGEILSRARKLTISTGANSIKIPAVDETSRALGSRWGGVQSYWLGEGSTATTSKPKFRLIELDLKKLMANWYVTDEMMADASVMNSIANEAFSEEIMFMTEDAMFRGTGAGQPLGFLNSPAVVSVAKETGQASKTIVFENVKNMWARMWGRSQQNAVWLINQDCLPQLYGMSLAVGTGGVPVYMPAGGVSGAPYATLFNRPVIPVEYADTVGNNGDISLVDMSQYVLADKGGIQAASSMHVAFLTDEMVFRITYRVDGEPIWNSPLTPYKGSNTQSPFITLAAR